MKPSTVSLSLPAGPPPELVRRHLGVPVDAALPDRVQTLMKRVCSWYDQFGKPWELACEVPIAAIEGCFVELAGGHRLSSELLTRGLREAGAHALVVLAVSAGSEVDEAIDQHWSAGRPDEAMFLNAHAIAFVEHARDMAAVDRASETPQLTMLPRYSPGYDGWDLADQAVLLNLIAATDEFRSLPKPPVELLEGGGLRPAKATLTVHGMTSRRDLTDQLESWWRRIESNIALEGIADACETKTHRAAPYSLPVKALRKWAANRLTIERRPHGRLFATFRFAGTTCANLGVPFAFDFFVTAQQESNGDYRIEACSAAPVAGDEGHRSMCGYLDAPESFLKTVSAYQPPVGETLGEVLQWSPDSSPTGCLCTQASHNHKWILVLQTLHFALQGE